jgi:hypothetical protein
MTTPKQAAGGPFKALVWLAGYSNVETLRYADPVDALAACVDHLQRGYQTRLSDNAVAWFQVHESVGGLKLSDANGARRAAPSRVAEVPAERLGAEREAVAEVPAGRPAEPATARRGRRAAQPPAEAPEAAEAHAPPPPEAEPAATARAARRGVRAAAVAEPAAPRRRAARALPVIPAAEFRAPAEVRA